MQAADDFRYKSHTLLLELDSSTVQMMKLVVLSDMGTVSWDKAVRTHHDAYSALHAHLDHPDAAGYMAKLAR
ncbi:hypothetical protein [Pseudomonas sp. W2-17]|uniref:hypothetical protein n=1 Tax=Pseudomonas sp. W2-17 TaxID=3058039 RepID=UPI0034E08EC6